MADAPEVKVRITAEDQGVSAAIRQLTTQLQSLKSKEKEVAESSLDLKEAFVGLLEVLAVEKLAEFGKEVFDTTTKILKLSQVTGLSTETLSVYASAATDAGVSFDEVSAGISKLSVVVTQFEQGNQKAAKAIALTGLSLKSLAGLNSEQKIRLITDAIAKMPPGFQKTTAETKLLGDGSGNLNKVLTLLAGEGFEKTREEAEKLGNLISTQTAEDFENLRAALADLKEESEGMVRQFEAGLVPSLTDIANAINRTTTEDGTSAFKKLGALAGEVLKDIVFGLELIGASLIDVFGTASYGIQNLATFGKELVTKGYTEARKDLAANDEADKKRLDGFLNDKLTATANELAGESRLVKEADDAKKRLEDKNRPKEQPVENLEALKGFFKLQEQQDAAYKRALAATIKAGQSEIEIAKAFDAEHAEEEKSAFERGLISLEDYYADRHDQIVASGERELASLLAQKAAEEAAEKRSRNELAKNKRGAIAHGGSDTVEGQEFQAAAAKNQADIDRAKLASQELDTKIAVQQRTNRKDLSAEDLARYSAEREQLTKLTEFQKTILDIQGKTAEAARIEAEAKVEEYRILLTSQKDANPEDIAVKVQEYRDLTTAVGQFDEQRKKGEDALKGLADERAAIEDRVKSGQIFQIQADEEIEALEKSRVGTLQDIAAAQLKAAIATKNEANITQARDFQKQVQTIAIESNSALTDIARIKQGVQQGLGGALESFFTSGITGARNLGQAFASLADSVVSSLQKIVAQMLVTYLMKKLLGLTSLAGGGGGDVGGIGANIAQGGAFAEGGLVSGPGTGTSDSIPARLSAGEFVMKSSSVRAIGVETLAALNQGLRGPTAFLGGVPRFAEGGLVTGSPRSGADASQVHLSVHLEEGIVLKHMASKGGAKVTVQHLANNPKQASKAIGRSR